MKYNYWILIFSTCPNLNKKIEDEEKNPKNPNTFF